MTLTELRGLDVVVDLPTAAVALKIGRTVAYELARTDEFPVPVRRHGKSYRVLRADLLAYLGVEDAPLSRAG